MHVGHFRQYRARKEIFQRFAERFFIRLRIFNFRFDDFFLRHFRHFRQGNQQAFQRCRFQGQGFLLPVQTGGEVHHRHRGVINLDVDVVQRHPCQGDGIRRGEIQRTAIFLFFNLFKFNPLTTVGNYVGRFVSFLG